MIVESAKIKRQDTNGWRLYAADFETTTVSYSSKRTKVWSFCVDEIGRYRPEIFGSIEDFFAFCGDVTRGYKKRFYFHNLKFDGQFIMYHLINVLHYRTLYGDDGMKRPKELLNGECVYIISDVGQWYNLTFGYKNVLVECRDSLKILPFTLEQVGKAFCTKYHKTEMIYDDKTSLSDCTPADIEYIKNDVLVLSEALSFLMKRNDEDSPFDVIESLTIGGAAFQQFKRTNYGENKNITIALDKMELEIDGNVTNADAYIRAGYRGGYCYVKEEIRGKTLNVPGFTADVNSLYPFEMCHKYSGSSYPYGKGHFHTGRPPVRDIESDFYYFYMRVRVSFELKDGYVPTIQKKNSFLYVPNAYLTSSRIMDYASGKYKGKPEKIEMTFSKDDWIVFTKHYNIIECEYLDYIEFMTACGVFDDYIESYAKIKRESTGATRSLAKLFSNSLYGQLSKGTNSSFKVAKTDGEALHYEIVRANNKKPVNIAIGAAITAKARRYQIETIQNNYDRFCYSDTDSLHCIGDPSDFVGKVDDKEYGAYKIEATWKRARFVRQKTYIEEYPDGYLNICVAGMTPVQKEIFRREHVFEDFRDGLTIHGGKLKPKIIPGGVILEETDFTIR